jgi:exportin-2 (importin alpha re-exporter)
VGNGNGQATNGDDNVSTRSIRTPRISPLDMRPILGALLPAVISALENSSRADEYLMRLLLRVITVSKTEISPYAQQILTVAAQVLSSVIQNPPNPLFCHYLFEVISALVSFSGNQSNVAMLEAGLVGHMQTILAQDLTEFGPYAFQVLSQLMALHSSELPSMYSDVIPPLLVPSMWDRRGYVRGMVLYLESYIKKDSSAVVRDGRLEPILGVFNKLVASKATDHLGIQLLCTILETYDAATMATYMNAIVRVLVTRLHAAKTPKYVQNLLYCLSLIVIRFGVETLVKSLDVLQQGLMAMLLSQVWINEVPSVMRPTDRRICAVALADIACATDLCRTEPYKSLWSSMLTATVALIEGVQTDAGDDVSDEEDSAPIESGEFYSGGHARLRWAAQAVPSGTGAATDIDPRAHLADRVASFSARHPGVYATLIAQNVEQAAQNALQSYLVTSGRTIV